jgi:hypothetical protein
MEAPRPYSTVWVGLKKLPKLLFSSLATGRHMLLGVDILFDFLVNKQRLGQWMQDIPPRSRP